MGRFSLPGGTTNNEGRSAESGKTWFQLGQGNGPGRAVGESREEAAGMWEQLALGKQDACHLLLGVQLQDRGGLIWG